MSEEANEHYCGLTESSLLFDSKWDFIIIYHLLNDKYSFNEIKDKVAESKNPITPSSLTRILRKLENNNIVKRVMKIDDTDQTKILYSLTDKGEDLRETIDALNMWGRRHKYEILELKRSQDKQN